MKQITTTNEAVNLILAAVYHFSLDSVLLLEHNLRFVINQMKLGAGTLGELALKNIEEGNENNGLPICPRCHSSSIVKNGTNSAGNQRYKCNECNHTFVPSTNSISSRVLQDAGKWMLFVQNLLKGETIADNARMCGIAENTALDWRLRVYEALEFLSTEVQLSGIVAADDTRIPYNLKGNHSPHFAMPRRSRKRGHQNTKKNYHQNQICVLCAVDKQGHCFSRCIGFGKPSGKRLIAGFAGKLCVDDNLVFVSDGDNAYGMVVKKYNLSRWEICISEKKGTKRYPAVVDDIHIQKANSYHSRLKEYLAPSHGTASRYLPGKMLLFDFMENNKHLSIDEMAIKILCAMTRNVSKATTQELKCKYCTPVSNGSEKYTWELKISQEEQAIYRDWTSGMPTKEVCTKYNVHRRKIYHIRDKVVKYQVHDTIMNPVDKSAKPKQKRQPLLTDTDWDVFKRNCRDKETLESIARDYGVNLTSIHKRVQKVRRTREGAALEAKWEKARQLQKQPKRKSNQREEMIRDIELMRNPQTSIKEVCAIAAASHNCGLKTATAIYYEHRRKTGDIDENYRWKKERLEMRGEEYYTFLKKRNKEIFRAVNLFLKAHPNLPKKDAFIRVAYDFELSVDMVTHTYYDVQKGKFPEYHRRTSGANKPSSHQPTSKQQEFKQPAPVSAQTPEL